LALSGPGQFGGKAVERRRRKDSSPMGKTTLSATGEKFQIDGQLTYSEVPGGNTSAHGLLMNARFIQGIFDDKGNRDRFARFGFEEYDPEAQTARLVQALPEWYGYGLRAFTVGLQGGGPVFTVEDWTTIDNNPFSEDGKAFDMAYRGRLERLLRAADDIGVVVIVSLFYQAQAHRMRDGETIRNAVQTACGMLKDSGHTNVIIEVANEYDVGNFSLHPLINTSEGMAYLVSLARKASGGMPVGASLGGGQLSREVAAASDVILIHANNLTRQEYYNMVKEVRGWSLNKPIVCNEDSPCVSQLSVAFDTQTSWGYYNNLTKQEPPTNWGVTPGEDTFFARRMALGIGIPLPELPVAERFYLQGFEEHVVLNGQRWVRLASLYPERTEHVEFLCNGEIVERAYCDPFMVRNVTTWIQSPVEVHAGEEWKAIVHLAGGDVVEVTAR
jgi:hypothetical protein